jgi:hypothetical protein
VSESAHAVDERDAFAGCRQCAHLAPQHGGNRCAIVAQLSGRRVSGRLRKSAERRAEKQRAETEQVRATNKRSLQSATLVVDAWRGTHERARILDVGLTHQHDERSNLA